VADVLDQSEVDALLAADAGRARPSAGSAAPSGASSECDIPVQILGALQQILQRCCQSLEPVLRQYLRGQITLTAAASSAVRFGQFVDSLSQPTCIASLHARALPAPLYLDLGGPLLYPLLERLLGGDAGACHTPQRPLTDLERRLVQLVAGLFAQHLSQQVPGVQLDVAGIQTEAQALRVVPAEQPLILAAIELGSGNHIGCLRLCVPLAVTPVLLRAVGCRAAAPAEPAPRVQLRALLEPAVLTAAEFQGFEVGDVITTEQAVDQPIALVGDGRLWRGQLGGFAGGRSVRILPEQEAP
jgi:flagellar motor switch protein FliM